MLEFYNNDLLWDYELEYAYDRSICYALIKYLKEI